ncbi:30S ribosomal protein S18 [bacterium]|nr:30S ribosomal protein S18 [bacterium]OIO89052.1 MAG: 30S ribosomal protein S18 [Anaerolineae bacterium CG2_30_58_95]PIU91508.1 MAG: 30S ribosomal protein S18 [Anaerolineae bacterium CG06_land_8_20_14_3_00_57_67]PIW20092.1 MAG: 30S ribosomal protein S18 [Anaerolineae bacterium CG17_big_fil_post_rev_8_21_14_2_50_57_27]PIX47516.1 MAG: 30S ribosomal protein S18 [Anaerolineae bacterium CG_4_8_14_3_um_filter_59_70]PJH76526.1 MAG: 30S ribosomal protein S18 [Anaerolineae bacterium CG_4_9_14_0_8_um_
MDHQYDNGSHTSGYHNGTEQSSGRRYYVRPKFCQFCVDKHLAIDYKQADILRRFVTEEGKIRPRRQTGTCAKHQRALAGAIKRARHIALLPFSGKSFEEDR